MFGGAVSTAGTHRAHGEGSPCAGSRREGTTKLSHGQTWVSDLVHGLSSEKSELRVGVCQRQRHRERLSDI